MSYDNAKLIQAVAGWLETYCKVGYGEVYSRELLQSFENYLRETAAMKSSPGIVVFAKEMTRRGFGRKRVAGLQYMTGLELITRVPVTERRLARAEPSGVEAEQERIELEAAAKAVIEHELNLKVERRKAKRRMKKETKDRIASAGELDGNGHDPLPV